jgi:hypothetical protein
MTLLCGQACGICDGTFWSLKVRTPASFAKLARDREVVVLSFAFSGSAWAA